MTTSPAAIASDSPAPSAAIDQLLTDLRPVELVRSYRSGTHENSHYGSLVILDRDGSVILQRGDVHRPVFHRSCAKPFQAVAMLELDAPLAGADLALAAASHSGEPEHVHRSPGHAGRSGFTEDDLGCPAALPSDPAAYRSVIRGSGGPRRVYMNCSGKHAAMLATCRIQGWPSAGYLDVDHPLQQRIRAVIETLRPASCPPASASTVAAHRSTRPRWWRWPAGSARWPAPTSARPDAWWPTPCGSTRTWSAAPGSTTPA